MVEQEATTQGIKMSRRVELLLIIKQETIVLPKAKPIVVEGVLVAVKMKYSEHRFNQ
jgi:GTP cyclohydrolase FolE2